MKDWEYSNFTKEASMFGGPAKFIATIKEEAEKEGIEKGLVIGLSALSAGVLVTSVSVTAYKKTKSLLAKRKQEKKLAKEAEEQLMQELHDMDENPDDTIQ
ncbi:hypothetical protein SKB07_16425 [Enterococcus faecium]